MKNTYYNLSYGPGRQSPTPFFVYSFLFYIFADKYNTMDDASIDKMMKPYWDSMFNDTYIGSKILGDIPWSGLMMDYGNGNKDIVIGHTDNDRYDWYYDGEVFDNHFSYFNVTLSEFNHSMKRYLIKTYHLEIESII